MLLLVTAIVVSAQAEVRVPSSLLFATDRPPLEFATLLANSSIPSGLELKESDDTRPIPSGAIEVTETAATIPALQLIEAFNSRHSDYRAALLDGVLVVRPTSGAVSFLDEPSRIRTPTNETGIMNAQKRVFSVLHPSLTEGASGGSRNPALDRDDDITITLDGDGRTNLATLNQIAARCARTWFVITQEKQDAWHISRFGYLAPEGFYQEIQLAVAR